MAADEKILGDLHTKVAEVLSIALDGEELPGYTEEDEDGNEIVTPPKRLTPSAAIIAAATKFLKDNNITAVASKDNALGELEKKLAERQQKKMAKATPEDFASATSAVADHHKFLHGLPN